MRIGFCGLGLMGAPMVERLMAAGHELTVWNRSPDKLNAAVAAGARGAATPAEAAADNEIVVLCLFDAAAVEQVVFGPAGVGSVNGPRYVVDHSSIAPGVTREFAGRLLNANAAQWVDAPVSGGVPGAKAGTLAVMAGGSVEAITALAAPLAAYAARCVRVGPTGAGQTAKLCNQMIVTTTLFAIAEAVVLAQRSGIDAALLPSALEGGWADSVLLRTFVPRMPSPPAQTIGTVGTLLKDSQMIARAALASGAAMPLGTTVREALLEAVGLGLAEADLSRVIEVIERRKP